MSVGACGFNPSQAAALAATAAATNPVGTAGATSGGTAPGTTGETCNLSLSAQAALLAPPQADMDAAIQHGQTLTTPDQEATALADLKSGQTFNRADPNQPGSASNNFGSAFMSYMNPGANPDPAHSTMKNMLTQQLQKYQEAAQGSGAPMDNLTAANAQTAMWSNPHMATIATGLDAKGNPELAGMVANLHSLASEAQPQ